MLVAPVVAAVAEDAFHSQGIELFLENVAELRVVYALPRAGVGGKWQPGLAVKEDHRWIALADVIERGSVFIELGNVGRLGGGVLGHAEQRLERDVLVGPPADPLLDESRVVRGLSADHA